MDFGAPPNPSSRTTAAPLWQRFPCFYCNIWLLDGVKLHTSDALEDIRKNIDFYMWLEVQCAIFGKAGDEHIEELNTNQIEPVSTEIWNIALMVHV